MSWIDTYPKKHPRTASRLVDGEAVIIIPDEGKVKMLNKVGSRIWELADGTHTVRYIVEIIFEEFKVGRNRARMDVVAFIKEMVESGLMTVEVEK